MIIYSIQNQLNHKRYIGYTTKTLNVRFRAHCKKSKKPGNNHFHQAISKYGEAVWKLEILENILEESDLGPREIFWIKEYDTFKNGYNSTEGGDGRGFIKGRKQEQYHIQKRVESFKRHFENLDHPLKGRQISEEKKIQISKTLTGVKHSEERKLHQAEAARNRPKGVCNRCGKIIDICNLNRWHNDNCKFKSQLKPSIS